MSTAGPWSFEPTPKLEGTPRAVPVEETLARLEQVAPLVPATRLTRLAPLDVLDIPVYGVCTPLAADLAVHLGKGATPEAARASALMEAVERVSAETPPAQLIRASYAELAADSEDVLVLDPAAFSLPDDTAYRADQPIDWVLGHDLLAGMPALVAADLAVNPPREGVLRDVDTNGLASGNLLLEAVVHGLCEIVERDALSQLEFAARFGEADDPAPLVRTLDPSSLPSEAGDWIERAVRAGFDLIVQDMTSDVRVATLCALLVDRRYADSGQAAIFLGLGTHPDARIALSRAICEAVQSRVAVIQGGRDSFNVGSARPRVSTRLAFLRRLDPVPRATFVDVPSAAHADLRDDLEFILERLRQVSVPSCPVVELTRPQLGLPVVRVRAAGLSQWSLNMRRVDVRCTRWLL